MTDESIRQLEWQLHELTLVRPAPQVEAMVNQMRELIFEIRRLRGLVEEAASYLKDHDPETAARIGGQVDWTSTSPVF